MARLKGKYFIDPRTAPFTTDENKRVWRVSGTRPWPKEDGTFDRPRKRFETYEAASTYLKQLLDEDTEYLCGKKIAQPVVLTSHVITSAGLKTDIEGAVSLIRQRLKLKPSEPLPDANLVTEAVKAAFAAGWDPGRKEHLIKDLEKDLRAHIDNLEKLGKKSQGKPKGHSLFNGIKEKTADNYRNQIKNLMALYGEFPISRAALMEFQSKLLDRVHSPDPSDEKLYEAWELACEMGLPTLKQVQVVLAHLCQMAKSRGMIADYELLVIPQCGSCEIGVMSREMLQAVLDASWNTEWATYVILMIFGALRRHEYWAPDSFLADNLEAFHVGPSCKTGERIVHLPPVAKTLLGLLEKTWLHVRPAQGPKAFAYWLGKVGFPVCPSVIRTAVTGNLRLDYNALSDEECMEFFRREYPQRFDSYIPNFMRHTGCSMYYWASQDPGKESIWAGHSIKVARKFYINRGITWEDAEWFYRLLPTQVRELLDANTIKLPDWWNAPSAEKARAERLAIQANVDKVEKAMLEKGIDWSQDPRCIRMQMSAKRAGILRRLKTCTKGTEEYLALARQLSDLEREQKHRWAANYKAKLKAQGLVRTLNPEGKPVVATPEQAAEWRKGRSERKSAAMKKSWAAKGVHVSNEKSNAHCSRVAKSRAKRKAQGLKYVRGLDGKQRWCTEEEAQKIFAARAELRAAKLKAKWDSLRIGTTLAQDSEGVTRIVDLETAEKWKAENQKRHYEAVSAKNKAHWQQQSAKKAAIRTELSAASQ